MPSVNPKNKPTYSEWAKKMVGQFVTMLAGSNGNPVSGLLIVRSPCTRTIHGKAVVEQRLQRHGRAYLIIDRNPPKASPIVRRAGKPRRRRLISAIFSFLDAPSTVR